MKLRSFLSAIALVAMSATSAFAADSGVSFTAEPYVGYGLIGSTNFSIDGGAGVSGDVNTGSLTGFGFGARGLVNFLELFFAGIDVSYYPSFSHGEPSTSSTYTVSLNGNPKNFKGGLVAGVALPAIPLRFWLGLNVIDKISTSNNSTDFSTSGLSFKVGAGFRPIPLLSINAEFIRSSYGTFENTTGGVTTKTDSGLTLTHNLLFLSASVPFTF